MLKHTGSTAGVDPTPCNCLALRQAGRHVSQLYDQHLTELGLRTSLTCGLRPVANHARRIQQKTAHCPPTLVAD